MTNSLIWSPFRTLHSLKLTVRHGKSTILMNLPGNIGIFMGKLLVSGRAPPIFIELQLRSQIGVLNFEAPHKKALPPP